MFDLNCYFLKQKYKWTYFCNMLPHKTKQSQQNPKHSVKMNTLFVMFQAVDNCHLLPSIINDTISS